MANTYIIITISGITLLMGVVLYLFHKLRNNKKTENKYGYNTAPKLINAYIETLEGAEKRMKILGKQLTKEQYKYQQLEQKNRQVIKELEAKYKKLRNQFDALEKDYKKLKAENFELTKENEILKSQI